MATPTRNPYRGESGAPHGPPPPSPLLVCPMLRKAGLGSVFLHDPAPRTGLSILKTSFLPFAYRDQLEPEPEPRLRREHESWLKSNAATDERQAFLPRKRRRPTKRPVTAPGGWFFIWRKGLWNGHQLGVCVVFRPLHMDM